MDSLSFTRFSHTGRSTRLSLKQDAENSHRLKDPSSCLLTITLSNSFLPHLPQSLVTTNLLFISQMSREQNRTDASSQPGLSARRSAQSSRVPGSSLPLLSVSRGVDGPPLFHHSPAEGPPGCFQVGAITDKAAVEICVLVFV